MYNPSHSSLNRNLPLLNKSAEFFNNINLDKVAMICIQHLFGTNYNMFRQLFNMGLKPSNIFLLGKCYSTDPEVLSQMQKDGIIVSEESAKFDSHVAYDIVFKENARKLLTKFKIALNSLNAEKIIILDDGGMLINQASKYLGSAQNVVCIEQTSSGYNRIKKHPLSFPVINVARSKIKTKYETPIIINLVVKKLKHKLKNIFPKPKNALIVGYGILGQRIYREIKSFCSVSYFDYVSNRSMFKQTELKDILGQFDLIIGTTGETSIDECMIKELSPPVTLVSLSSSDREFDAISIRRKLTRTSNCHMDLSINGINLINCGFPVNFDSDFQQIDTDEFQLTRALIFGAICQAISLTSLEPRFVDLDALFQKFLESEISSQNQENMLKMAVSL